MLAKTTGLIFYLLTGLFLVLLSASFVFFIFVSYDHLVQMALTLSGRPDLQQVVTQKFFTPEKFLFLMKASRFVSAAALLLTLGFIKYGKRIRQHFQLFFEIVFDHSRNFYLALVNNAAQVNVLLAAGFVIILARSIFYANAFYIQHDEAWNYNFFVSKNVLNSLFIYNNYPLHNIVSWIVLKLFSVSTFILRLPSVAAGLLCCATVFVIVKKIFGNEWIALCSMILFACLPVSVFYMLYARGVLFEMFFAWIVCYLLYRYLQQKPTVTRLTLLGAANALGVLSMLSHLYFIVFSTLAVLVCLCFQRERPWRFMIMYPLLSFVFSLIVLLPMMAGSGLSPGLTAGTADANYLVLHLLPVHCYADFYTGLWFGIYPLFALYLYFIFLSAKKHFRFLFVLNVSLLCAPLIIRGLAGVWMPERALAFLGIVPVLSVALIFYEFKLKVSTIVAFTFTAALGLSIHTHLHDKLRWSEEKDRQAYEMYKVMSHQQLKSIYNQSPEFIYFIPAVQFYFLCNKNEVKYSTGLTGSNRYAAQRPSDTDCLISRQPQTEGQLIFAINELYIYKLP